MKDPQTEIAINHFKKMVNIHKYIVNLTQQALEISQNTQKTIDKFLIEKDNQIQQLRNQISAYQEPQQQSTKIKITELDTSVDTYNKILAELEKTKSLFTDKDFPPNAQSIGFEYNDQAWARASEFCQEIKFFCNENGPNVFGENGQVKPEDIVQGTMGNDRLYGVVYLLANHCPKLLEQNFITKKVSKNCIYALKLYHQSTEKIIIVDDYLPYNWDYQLHIKLLGKDFSIWIGILEKAIAKMYGSYHTFDHLRDQDLIQILTNAPYIQFNTQDEQFLDTIQEEIDLNSFVFVGPSNIDPMNFYQIIGVKEFHHPDLKEIKLLEMRCPWGGRQWKGDWSYTSHLLTPELRKQMNYDKEDNGVFYMDQLSFMQNFLRVKSFRLNANKLSQTLMSCRKQHAVYCKVKVDEPSSYFIQLKRIGERDVHVIHKIVIVSCDSNNQYSFVHCFMQDHLDTYVNVNLRKGTYVFYIKVLWDHQETEDLQLRISGSSIVEIAEIQKIPNLLKTVFDKLALSRRNQKQVGPQTQLLLSKLEYEGWALYVVENPFEKLVTLRFQCQMENAKLSKPNVGDSFKQQLAPKSFFTILVKKYYKSVVQITPHME